MLLRIIIVAICASLIASCAVSPAPRKKSESLTGKLAFEAAPRFTDAELQQFTTSYNDFAWAMFVSQAQDNQNLVISPFSLYQTLGMLYAGAAGQTAEEMVAAMRLPEDTGAVHRLMNALNQQLRQSAGSAGDDGFELKMANAIWAAPDRAYQQAFLDTLSQNYGSGLNTLDFTNAVTAADTINAWIAGQTAKKITNLADPSMFSGDTALALTNAVFFKAAWKFPFNEHATAEVPFMLLDGKEISVPTMHLNETLYISSTAEGIAVRLPYEGGSMVMEILMPNPEAWSRPEDLTRLMASHKAFTEMEPVYTALSLPKFRVESPTMDLIPALQASGMRLAFTNAADFSGISGDQSLYVSTVAQKAFIDVNEKGTEAAAASIAVVRPKMAPGGEPLKLTIDHPFIYQIRDTATSAILFMGAVMQP